MLTERRWQIEIKFDDIPIEILHNLLIFAHRKNIPQNFLMYQLHSLNPIDKPISLNTFFLFYSMLDKIDIDK